jgi:hypothetical protein
MEYRPLCCYDCGVPVLEMTRTSVLPLPSFRRVQFRLTGGVYEGACTHAPFCLECASKPWTPERLKDFEEASNRVRRANDPIHVVACEGYRTMSEPIVAVFGAA